MKEIGVAKLSRRRERRLAKASRDFARLWERVRPFVKRRHTEHYSTSGKWQSSCRDL